MFYSRATCNSWLWSQCFPVFGLVQFNSISSRLKKRELVPIIIWLQNYTYISGLTVEYKASKTEYLNRQQVFTSRQRSLKARFCSVTFVKSAVLQFTQGSFHDCLNEAHILKVMQTTPTQKRHSCFSGVFLFIAKYSVAHDVTMGSCNQHFN